LKLQKIYQIQTEKWIYKPIHLKITILKGILTLSGREERNQEKDYEIITMSMASYFSPGRMAG
jgi:hypothetical protein